MKRLLFFLVAYMLAIQSMAQAIWDGTASYGWYIYNDGTTPYEIYTAEEFAGFSNIVNGTVDPLEGIAQDNFAGKTVKLMDDIWLNEDEAETPLHFIPIGGRPLDGQKPTDNNASNETWDAGRHFAGSFNGNYHTIYNLYVYKGTGAGNGDADGTQGALFGSVGGTCRIENLILKNPIIHCWHLPSTFVSVVRTGANLTIQNCIATNFLFDLFRESGGWAQTRAASLISWQRQNSTVAIINCGATGGNIECDWGGIWIGQKRGTVTITNSYYAGYNREWREFGSDGGSHSGSNNYAYTSATNFIDNNGYIGATRWTGASDLAHMKTQAFVDQLNGTGLQVWKFDADNVNDGFPIPFNMGADCQTIDNLTASNATNESIDLTWNSYETAQYYEIEWGPATFTPGNSEYEGTDNAFSAFYQIQGLTEQTNYKVAVRSNCGGLTSPWISVNFGTTATETFGNEIWHGYVYGQTASTVKTFGNYLGYVEEQPQFDRNSGSSALRNGPWTGINPVWIATAPSENFSVRYLMTYDFSCGNYVFTITADDVWRLSIDGGQTWLPSHNGATQAGTDHWTTGCCSPWQTDAIPLEGTYDLVLEFSEGGGEAYLTVSWAEVPVSITSVPGPYAAELTFSNGANWDIKVSTTPLGDPENDPADILTDNTSSNPYTLTDLPPQTTYYVYAFPTDCGNLWGSHSFMTTILCAQPSGISSSNVETVSADLTWNAPLNAGFFNIEWGPQGSFTPGNSDAPNSDAAYESSYQITTGLVPATTYTVAIQCDCGGSEGTSQWTTYTLTTERCDPNEQCIYTLQLWGQYSDSWSTSNNSPRSRVIISQNGIEIANHWVTYGSTSQTFSVSLCKNLPTVITFTAGTYANECSFELRSPTNTIAAKMNTSQSWVTGSNNMIFAVGDDCNPCFAPAITSSAITEISFNLGFSLGASWNIKVSTVPLADPTNDVADIEDAAETTDNPYTVQNLTAATLYYVYVQNACGSNWANAEVTTLASCLPPTALTVSSVDYSSAHISWTAPEGVTSFIIEYGPSTFTPGTGNSDYASPVNETSVDISGLTEATAYKFAVRSDCDDGVSVWVTINFGTSIEDETYGDGIWHGYVYNTVSQNNAGIATFGEYKGYVEELTPQFDRDCGSNAWTGENAVWASPAPSDWFSVRYRMQYTFPCGFYTFKLGGCGGSSNIDDQARLSLDGGETWIVGNNVWGTTSMTGTWTGTAFLNGVDPSDMVLEFFENGGGARLCISWAATPVGITVSSITSSSANAAFSSGESWNIVVSTTVEANPSDPQNAVDVQYSATENPYYISGLEPTTQYWAYVQTDCGGAWNHATFTTLAACETPTALSVSNVTASSADFNWTAPVENATSYEIEIGETGFIPGGSTTVYATATSDTFISVPEGTLTEATTYTVAVRTICDAGQSGWVTLNFGTAADETYGDGIWHGYVYNSPQNCTFGNYLGMVFESEQFDRNTGNAWTGNQTVGADIWVGTAPVDHFTVRYKMTKTFPCGNYTFSIGYDDCIRLSIDGGQTWLIADWWGTTNCCHTVSNPTPVYFDGSTPVDLVLEFYDATSTAQAKFSYAASLVGITVSSVTSTSANATFNSGESWNTVVSTSTEANPSDPQNVVDVQYSTTGNPYAISGLTPTTQYWVYVQTDCGGAWNYATFTTLAACEIPTALQVFNITSSSADFKWKAPVENATSYEIEIGEAGFTPGGSTAVYATTIPDTFLLISEGTLTEATAYTVAVRTLCSTGESEWVTLNFTTTADETYGNGEWNGYVYSAPSEHQFVNFLGSVNEPAQFSRNRLPESLQAGPWTGVNPNFIGTPPSDAFSARYRMTYNFTGSNYMFIINADDHFRLSVDGGQTWLPFTKDNTTTSETTNFWTTSCCAPWHSATVAITGSQDLVLEFYEGGGGAYLDFSFINMDCQAPTNVVATNVTMTDAEISWTGIDEAVDYTVEVCAPGEMPGNGNIYSNPNVTSPVSVTGLTAATVYTVYVKSNCSNDESSYAITTFNTPICDPSEQCNYTLRMHNENYGYADDWGNTQITVRQNGILVYTSPLVPGGYGSIDFTYNVLLCKNLPSEIVAINTAYYYNNGSYCQWELKDFLGAIVASKSDGTTINPSPNFTAACPTCLPPANIAATPTTTTADITWTANPDASEYDIQYKASSVSSWTDPSVEIITGLTTTPYQLTGLLSNTIYNVRIRSVCVPGGSIENEDFSPWTVSSFQTLCGPGNISDMGTTEGAGAIPWVEPFSYNDAYQNNHNWSANGQRLPDCWTLVYTTGNLGDAPYIHGGNQRLDFCGDFSGGFKATVMPQLPDEVTASQLRMKFWYSQNASGTYVKVCMVDNPNSTSISDYEMIQQVSTNGDHSISFENYTGSARFIAFVVEDGGGLMDNLRIWIDNTVPVTCTAPTGVTVSAITQTAATVSWTASATATSYEVAYKLASSSTWIPADMVAASETSTGLSTLDAETQYDVRVRSICDDGESTYATASFTTLANPVCNIPTALNHNTVTDVSATITWTAGGNETQWQIAWKKTANSNWNNSAIVTNEPSHNLSGLDAATGYDVRVRAICAAGDTSNWTAIHNFTTLPAPSSCIAPVVSVTDIGTTAAIVTWTAGGNETQWVLEYGIGSSYDMSAAVSMPLPYSYALGTLQPNTTYSVRMRAVCSVADTSYYSNVATFTTLQITCNAPDNLHQTTVDEHSISITWTPVNGETKWTVSWAISGSAGNATVNDSPNYTLTDLLSDTVYQICVRAICSDAVQSTDTCIDVRTIGINDIPLASGVKLYPNPASEQLTIEMESRFNTVEVTSTLGQVVYRASLTEKTKVIDVTGYSAGMYYVRLQGDAGTVTKKFVKR